jgi:outer membrane protein assembly factor BamA
MANLGASYQHGLNGSRVRYFRYETQLEGRMPLARGRTALLAQGSAERTRTRPDSDPVPFYLLPRAGGSSTLRGFPLDRYSGRNMVLATFEYRYQIHPAIQTYIFFDEGQVFDRTSDLRLMNWHRNYGLGFRLRNAASTFMRLELGYGMDGFAFHLSFGDPAPRPLGGPIRYGTYRR